MTWLVIRKFEYQSELRPDGDLRSTSVHGRVNAFFGLGLQCLLALSGRASLDSLDVQVDLLARWTPFGIWTTCEARFNPRVAWSPAMNIMNSPWDQNQVSSVVDANKVA